MGILYLLRMRRDGQWEAGDSTITVVAREKRSEGPEMSWEYIQAHLTQMSLIVCVVLPRNSVPLAVRWVCNLVSGLLGVLFFDCDSFPGCPILHSCLYLLGGISGVSDNSTGFPDCGASAICVLS